MVVEGSSVSVASLLLVVVVKSYLTWVWMSYIVNGAGRCVTGKITIIYYRRCLRRIIIIITLSSPLIGGNYMHDDNHRVVVIV